MSTQTATEVPATMRAALRPGSKVMFFAMDAVVPAIVVAVDEAQPGRYILAYVHKKQSYTVSAAPGRDDGEFALEADLEPERPQTLQEQLDAARARGERLPSVNQQILYRDPYLGDLRARVTAVMGVGYVSLTAFHAIRLARVRPGIDGREVDRWYPPSSRGEGWVPGVGDRVTVLRPSPPSEWGGAPPESLACWGTVLEADGSPTLPLVEVDQPRAISASLRGRSQREWRFPTDSPAEGVAPARVETLRLPIEGDQVWWHLWDSRISKFENVKAEITFVRSTEIVDLFLPSLREVGGVARLGRDRTGDAVLRVSRGNCMNGWSYDRVAEKPACGTMQAVVLTEADS